jgi:hypothetical protein
MVLQKKGFQETIVKICNERNDTWAMEVFWNIQDCTAPGQHYHIVFNVNFHSRKKKQFFHFCWKKQLGIKRKSNGVVTDEEKLSLFHQTIKT